MKIPKKNGPKVTGKLVMKMENGKRKDRFSGWFQKGVNAKRPAVKTSVQVKENAPKVLYVTHEPGQWHDYTGQRKKFEKLAKKQNWTVDVLSSSYEGLLIKLSQSPNFAKNYDVVVYNICVAETKRLMAAYNVLKQTQQDGVNSLLIHGAMHSFWYSFCKRGQEDKKAATTSVGTLEGAVQPKVLNIWEKTHSEKDFPVWGDFCGMASCEHTFKAPVHITKLKPHHSVKNVPDEYTTIKTELYMPLYKTDNLQEILWGKINEKKQAPVLWEHNFGKGKVIGFSLGHFTAEWDSPYFQSILVDSINYLSN